MKRGLFLFVILSLIITGYIYFFNNEVEASDYNITDTKGNLIIGTGAAPDLASWSRNNTIIGSYAGALGDSLLSCIFIGNTAGYDSTDTTGALAITVGLAGDYGIYGNFVAGDFNVVGNWDVSGTSTINGVLYSDGGIVDPSGTVVGANFAGLYVRDASTATEITVVNVYTKVTAYTADMPEVVSDAAHATDDITIGATGTYKIAYANDLETAAGAKDIGMDVFCIAATVSGTAITAITKADPAVVTMSAAHGLENGDRVKITGVVGMVEVNDQIFTVAAKAATTFALDADDGTDINSGGYTDWSSGGTVTLATRVDQTHAHADFAIQDDARTMSATGFAECTAADTYEIYIKNITDAVDCTVGTGQFIMERVK